MLLTLALQGIPEISYASDLSATLGICLPFPFAEVDMFSVLGAVVAVPGTRFELVTWASWVDHQALHVPHPPPLLHWDPLS